MVEFVRHVDDIVVAHHKVTGMNFIPGGYTMPAAVQEAHAKAESQIVASGATESKTELPSPTDEDEFHNVQDDDDFPPSPTEEDLHPTPTDEDLSPSPIDEDLHPLPTDLDLPPTHPDEDHNLSPHQDVGRPPAQETQAVPAVELPPTRDLEMLKLDIWKSPPTEKLIQ